MTDPQTTATVSPEERADFEAWKAQQNKTKGQPVPDAPDQTFTKGVTEKQDKPPVAPDAEDKPEYYVHLADGSVRRVAEEDLPTTAGTNAAFGHWVKDGKVYTVIGIYPAEIEQKG